eukprot:m.73603 g.73603  ORF g.73603 m.73603 type:complete len:200 (+) comp18824_c0_seq1:1094-1693(+)
MCSSRSRTWSKFAESCTLAHHYPRGLALPKKMEKHDGATTESTSTDAPIEEPPPAVEESDSAPQSDRRVTAAGDADDAPTTTAGGKSLDTVIDLKSDEEDADAGTPPDARGLVWSGVTVKVPTRSGEKTILADCAGSCAVGQVREWDERSLAHTRTHAALSLRVPRFAPTPIDLDRRCAYSTPPFGIYPHVPWMSSRQK